MCQPSAESPDDRVKRLEKRIKQLGDKASQLLLFLSFALVVAAILESEGNALGPLQRMLLTIGMRCWGIAIFPILFGVLPVKEIGGRSEKWYSVVCWSKFVLLWAAIICVIIGTVYFVCAIWRASM
jgi:hypothetical protein